MATFVQYAAGLLQDDTFSVNNEPWEKADDSLFMLDEKDVFSNMSIYINNVDYILNPCDSCCSDNNGSKDICWKCEFFKQTKCHCYNSKQPQHSNNSLQPNDPWTQFHHACVQKGGGGLLSTALLILKLGWWMQNSTDLKSSVKTWTVNSKELTITTFMVSG